MGYPNMDIRVLLGNSNEITDAILLNMPDFKKGRTMLSFCFVDPYNLDNLRFSTIERLAARFMDFLILIPSGYDGNRNEDKYILPDSKAIENFTGDGSWRNEWEQEKAKGRSFEIFLTGLFGRSMKGLGYIDPGIENTARIVLPGKNVLLYRLGLYSRAALGVTFWKQAKKYTDRQTDMFE